MQAAQTVQLMSEIMGAVQFFVAIGAILLVVHLSNVVLNAVNEIRKP